MYSRILNVTQILERKSLFLFGPRQTGKSTWLKSTYPEATYINLLSQEVFQDYLLKTDSLASDIYLAKKKNKSKIIIIDEVQKIPELLDEVHNQIELNKDFRFILTGSSSRKLKRAGTNLLGGRASWQNFFPLVYPELQHDIKTTKDLEKRLATGGLPSVFSSSDYIQDLKDYLQLYLQEEVKAEGLVRNYQAFHQFLLTASLSNSGQINFSKIGSDAQVPQRTVYDYFQILQDTLVGFMLPPFTETISRKAMTSSKFYFFDTGVSNIIKKRTQIFSGTIEFGESFEHFIVTEVKAYISYKNKDAEIFYWRSTSKHEVDLIIRLNNQIFAIEIKSKDKLTAKDYLGLQAFAEDFPKTKKYIVTSNGRRSINVDNKIEVIPVFDFLKALWSEEFF